MPDEQAGPRRDRRRGGADLRVRDAEQDGVEVAGEVELATERAVDGHARVRERGGERRAEPAGTDDRDAAYARRPGSKPRV